MERELGSDDVRVQRDAKIPDLWRMSALLEICPKAVKEQMLMRLDESGENDGKFNAKVIFYTTNAGARRSEGDNSADGT